MSDILLKRKNIGPRTLGVVGTAVFLMVTLFGFCGMFDWRFDLLSHFRMQYACVQIVMTLCALFWSCVQQHHKRWVWLSLAILNGVFFVLNALTILPYYLSPPSSPPVAGAIRLFHLNVLAENRDVDAVADSIKSANADVVSLQEYNTWWQKQMGAQPILKVYPYRLVAS